MGIIGSTGARRISGSARRGGAWRKIAVLLESGRSGMAALDRAVALSGEHEAELLVIAVAPQAQRPPCGGLSPQGYNDAVCDAVMSDLWAAERRVGQSSPPTSFVLLIDGRDDPLDRWIAERGVDLVLLPTRHPVLRAPRHPAARRLRRRSGAEVRVVAP